jgi:hypothetical protein
LIRRFLPVRWKARAPALSTLSRTEAEAITELREVVVARWQIKKASALVALADHAITLGGR